MAQQIKVRLPEPHPAQKKALARAERFNIVAMGEDGGKTTLGIEALLAGDKGALRGHPVAWFSATDTDLTDARRRVLRAVDALITARPSRRRVELVTGGTIDFYSLDDKRLDAVEQYATIVVDDAAKCDRLLDLWEDVFLPSLRQHQGTAWVLSHAFGKKNAFYKLWRLGSADPDFSCWQFPSDSNPYLPDETREALEAATEVERQQRFEAEFLDVAFVLNSGQRVIKPGETFRIWCERLATDGLKVDGKDFKLDDRPAMAWIYDQIPYTHEDAYNYVLVLMKCAQVGFTVMEMLASIYLGLRFGPATVGMFLPDVDLAGKKSSERFMPVVRSVPDVHRLMTMDAADGSGRKSGEGNVRTRRIGEALFLFSWTTGRSSTESMPMDVLSFDEVQEMSLDQMEKTRERLSASPVRFTLMGSTANWPDSDIDAWYKKGSQYKFHTECPHCLAKKPLDDYFPNCIKFDNELGIYRYVCFSCGGWIEDTQRGEWIPEHPELDAPGDPRIPLKDRPPRIRSIHFPQFLSPTISAGEIITAYNTAVSLKNFYNRKLGKPWADPSAIPVNLQILQECADAGMAIGLQWKKTARNTFMGIDQMGQFNVVTIKERLPDGRQAYVHLEYIFSDDPFARCSDLMSLYGVQACVVETLPNYNDAKRFAQRHPGRVFLAGYGNMEGEMLIWGDTPTANASDRRTDEDALDRYTVRLDQYKCMQVSMARFVKKMCLFPDPDALVQEYVEKGIRQQLEVCRKVAFHHFTKTALVVEEDEDEKKFKRKVIKVGIDPHTSYANMLCDVAWARAHGTSTFLMPDPVEEKTVQIVRGGGAAVVQHMPAAAEEVLRHQLSGDVCGRCTAFQEGRCLERGMIVRPKDPGCFQFIAVES